MNSSVIVFPGSNCDRDISVALEKFKIKNQMIWHDETNLPKTDLVILPGGFSYGDYLRTGCIASKSKIINEVIKHAKKGALVLGICNGFQILIETGLLPGVLLRNKELRFLSKNVFLKVINSNNKFCSGYKNKNIIKLPIAHNEGNFFANEDLLKNLEDKNLITFKYCLINLIIFTLFLSFKRHFLPGILFYEGVTSLVLSTTFLLFYLLKINNPINNKSHNYYSIIISFFLILTFHTTVITIVDRSISIFIISNVKNGVSDPLLIRGNFINNFVTKGIDKRIQEQIGIGNIKSEKENLQLIPKGEFYYQIFSLIQKIYNTDKNILKK